MLRWIGRLISLLVVLVFVALGLVAVMPADRVAGLAADQLRNLTGRDVTISGDVSLSFWPVLGASVGALEVGNAEWSRQGPMLSAQSAALGVDAMALLRGEIRITHIEAQAPTIRLESRADGRASWQFTDASGTAQIATETTQESTPRGLSIERLEVLDATLIYDAEGADLIEYSGVDLALSWPDQGGAAQISATLRPAGDAVDVSAEFPAFAAFLAGELSPVTVALASDQGRVGLSGQASIAGAVEGDLTLETNTTAGFLQSLALPGPELPAGLGRALSLSSTVSLTPDRQLTLSGLTADLGAGNRITGRVQAALNGVPQVAAVLDAGALDLTGLTDDGANGGGAGGGSAAPDEWPTTPIDASGLAAFNGEITLTAQSVDLGALRLGAVSSVLRNDRSRMVFALQNVVAYGGQVTGEFVMNNRSGLSVGGNLRAADIQMLDLLSELAGIDRFTGPAEFETQFLGVGQSVDAIMRSLSGSGRLSMGRGTILGIDLDRLLRAGAVGGGTTVFDSLNATYTIDAGTLRNDDLLMLLPSIEARGEGRVGLGARDLDYTVTPRAFRVGGGDGLAIPVRFRGSWADPRIEPDLEAALDLNFKYEVKEVERNVRERVQESVAEELGVERNEGQSVEDAIEKKIENEVGRQLRKLFD